MRRPIQIDAAQSVLIDALDGETFLIKLTTSIKQLRVKNVSPGQLYVFVFTQDRVGNHTVTWGSEVRNAPTVDADPQTTTVQTFIGMTGGTLEANTPAGFSE